MRRDIHGVAKWLLIVAGAAACAMAVSAEAGAPREEVRDVLASAFLHPFLTAALAAGEHRIRLKPREPGRRALLPVGMGQPAPAAENRRGHRPSQQEGNAGRARVVGRPEHLGGQRPAGNWGHC